VPTDADDSPDAAEEQERSRSQRAERAALAVLVALGLSVILVVLAGRGAEAPTGSLGGDFPEFYGIGRIVLDGDAHSLYDPATQAAAQRSLLPPGSGYLDFSYPPAMALLYAPLAVLPYRVAYLVYVAGLVAAVGASLLLLGDSVPWIGRNRLVALAGALTFFPLLRSVLGGQNTALSVLVVVLAWRARTARRPFVAGLWIGALLLKPQLAVLIVVVFLLAGAWRVIAGVLTTGVAILAGSTALSGWSWVGDFVHHLRVVSSFDAGNSRDATVSLVTLLQSTGVPVVVVVLGGLALAAAAVAVVWRAVRLEADDATRPAAFALVATASVVLAPHAIFYDAGMAALALAASTGPGRRLPTAVRVLWALGWLGALASVLPVNPLVVVTAAAAFLVGWCGPASARQH
jgi:hypothetical protein